MRIQSGLAQCVFNVDATNVHWMYSMDSPLLSIWLFCSPLSTCPISFALTYLFKEAIAADEITGESDLLGSTASNGDCKIFHSGI